MTRRHGLVRAALTGLAAVRADRWLPVPADAAGMAVTLHHVRPEQPRDFAPNRHLSVTPEFLEEFIRLFREAGWEFVSVDDLLSGQGRHRRIAVTLDDGYRDNAEHGLPIFRRHQVPFCVYVCAGFAERTAELWWEALEQVIAGTDQIAGEADEPGWLSTRTPTEKQKAFDIWLKWMTIVADESCQRAVIRRLTARYGVDLARLCDDLVLPWDGVRALAAEPLCTIGAHTLTHPALARLPADRALAEMAGSADRIERELGLRPTTIAFPYGYAAAAGQREARLAAKAGFAASFTTRPGYVPRGGSRHGLRRVSLNGLYQDPRLYRALLSPGLWRVAPSRL